jgi:hypothetical protein
VISTDTETDLSSVIVGLLPRTYYDIKIEARNLIGYSPESAVVSILAAQVPDAPIELQNIVDVTNAFQIGLVWTAAGFDGGSPVLDFRVWFDNAEGGEFTVLASNVPQATYTATQMTTGLTYRFRVEARNIYGYSYFSNIVSILAAQKPDIPVAPTTTFINDNVIISWTPPLDRGSPITTYSIVILQADGNYQQSATYCDGTTQIIVGAA